MRSFSVSCRASSLARTSRMYFTIFASIFSRKDSRIMRSLYFVEIPREFLARSRSRMTHITGKHSFHRIRIMIVNVHGNVLANELRASGAPLRGARNGGAMRLMHFYERRSTRRAQVRRVPRVEGSRRGCKFALQLPASPYLQASSRPSQRTDQFRP